MPKLYHLGLDRKSIRGARVALLPGDPGRCPLIAAGISRVYGARASEIAFKREFRTFLASVGDSPVLVTSTGIGGPSTSIAVDELAQIGVRTFVRVGSTGSIQPNIKMGDVIITTGAVRLDGASTHYAPIEFPAVAHHEVTGALIGGAEKAGVKWHAGVSASSDTFYPGEERDDSFRKYTIKRFQGSAMEWQRLGVLNYEMEAATLLTMTASMGLRGGCITGVINRGSVGRVSKKNLKLGQANVIRAAVLALEGLLKP